MAKKTKRRPKISLANKEFQKWAKPKKPKARARALASAEDRITALEALVADHQNKLRFVRIIEHQDPTYGTIYGWMFAGCRVGVNTEYWMHQNRGQGASFSLGSDFDRFGVYVEMEGPQVCPDNPTVGIYAACLAQGRQQSQGIVASAGGASTSYGVVSSPNLLVDAGDGSGRGYLHRVEGVQLLNIPEWYVGHTVADAKRLYP